MGLKDRVVVITGAGSGIGRAIALEFARKDAFLVINDLQPKSLLQLHHLLEQKGRKAVAIDGDINLPAVQRRLIQKALREFAGIDILVNNAGQLLVKPFLNYTPQDFNKIFSVNFRAPFLLTQRVVKVFAEKKIRGTIINVSSISGEVGFPYLSLYSATKGAITALTRSLAVELAPLGVRVNAVLPGLVATKMTEQELRGLERLGLGKRENLRRQFIEAQLIKRMLRPKEVALAVSFLADEELCGGITGLCLPVDAGYLVK